METSRHPTPWALYNLCTAPDSVIFVSNLNIMQYLHREYIGGEGFAAYIFSDLHAYNTQI